MVTNQEKADRMNSELAAAGFDPRGLILDITQGLPQTLEEGLLAALSDRKPLSFENLFDCVYNTVPLEFTEDDVRKELERLEGLQVIEIAARLPGISPIWFLR